LESKGSIQKRRKEERKIPGESGAGRSFNSKKKCTLLRLRGRAVNRLTHTGGREIDGDYKEREGKMQAKRLWGEKTLRPEGWGNLS